MKLVFLCEGQVRLGVGFKDNSRVLRTIRMQMNPLLIVYQVYHFAYHWLNKFVHTVPKLLVLSLEMMPITGYCRSGCWHPHLEP